MSVGNERVQLQERVINLTYHFGRPLSQLPLADFENLLYNELSSLEKQDMTYEAGRGLETIPHLLDVGRLVEFYLTHSDFLKQDYFNNSEYSPYDWQRMILIGAYLHDVGKNHLDARLLGRRGDLSREQLEEIKTHVNSSSQELETLGLEEPIQNIAFYHHERVDGSGYPDGLKGDEIPREVLPVSFFDALHAIATRNYFRRTSKPKSAGEAVKYATNHLSKRFDQGVVEFVRSYAGSEDAPLYQILQGMMDNARNR
ncbi:HD domain-containing protein [Candidatus Woesearchaeota archaeon]|nr:MAG: HD domain-containing protein [Candidatus Woesearchaeota archaeon]